MSETKTATQYLIATPDGAMLAKTAKRIVIADYEMFGFIVHKSPGGDYFTVSEITTGHQIPDALGDTPGEAIGKAYDILHDKMTPERFSMKISQKPHIQTVEGVRIVDAAQAEQFEASAARLGQAMHETVHMVAKEGAGDELL